MLGKLMKYEMKSTSRLLLPFFAAVLVLSALNRLAFVVFSDIEFLNIPRAFLMFTYVLLTVATCAMSYFTMINRFYKSVLGEEGYLTMTLPVKVSTHILSKTITNAIWLFTTIVVIILSIFLMLPDYSFITTFFSQWSRINDMFFKEVGMNLTVFTVTLIFAGFIAILDTILMIYTAMAFGQLASKHRGLTSFAAYIAIYAVVQGLNIAMMFLVVGMNWEILNSSTLPKDFFLGLILGAIIISTILCFVYFFVTRYLLDKKLNLE